MKGVGIMFRKFKLAVGQWLNNPNARVILILGILLIAAVAGASPLDFGG
jgi:hypothetical protein